MNAAAPRIAWHYTTAHCAQKILADGYIRPATAYVPEGERPVVWFSARQHWEPTASKAVKFPDGSIRRLTMRETLERGGGSLWRFGIPPALLLPWKQLCKAANVGAAMARGLERAGRAQGADPAIWYGSLESVDVNTCEIELMQLDEWTNKIEVEA